MAWTGSAGKLPGKALGPVIGRQMHRPAARLQFMRQRLGRKQMAAGAAGRKKDAPFAMSSFRRHGMARHRR